MADRPTTLHQLADAVFRAYLGELALDERRGRNDPVKLRFGGWDDPGSEYVATLSFDVLEGDEDVPVRREQGYIGFLLDPDPCIDLFLQQRAGESEDRTMVRVARFSAARIELLVPVAGFAAASGGITDTMWAPDGSAFTQQQSDGNFVTYKATVPFSKDNVKAVWSAWTGKL